MNRRGFLKSGAVAAAAAAARSARGGDAAPRRTVVAMPISVAPLADPDLDRTLADMRRRGRVNAIFPFIFTHETHRAGVPANFPGFRGGDYAEPHMEFYRQTPFSYADLRAPEFGGRDLLARLVPAARRQGIATYAWIIEDNHCPPIPHWEDLYEVDFHGRRVRGHPSGPCKNHPAYRALLCGLVEDYLRSYGVEGIMWGAERQSGFLNVLGVGDPGRGTCFCEYCRRKGKAAGIDGERARQGFEQLEPFRRAQRAGRRPPDGYFSSFWRVVMRYPELLAWENLWVTSRHELQALIYRTAKSIAPQAVVGWHLWQNTTFSPFQRAEEDYAVLAGFSDFVRPALYNNCAGERMRVFAGRGLAGVFGDLPPAETLQVLYGFLGDREAPYESVAQSGFTADYVRRETGRAVRGLAGSSTEVWPGVDIDVPVGAGSSRCTPGGIRAAVHAAFAGGAKGIILSRNYTEMRPEHLSAAGDALRELGVS